MSSLNAVLLVGSSPEQGDDTGTGFPTLEAPAGIEPATF